MAKSVTLYPLGVGDAFTARHFFVNCLINVDGREFFIDCPAYLGKMFHYNNENGEQQLELNRYRELFEAIVEGRAEDARAISSRHIDYVQEVLAEVQQEGRREARARRRQSVQEG